LAPHHDAETTRIRLFALSWMGNPSFSRVEQIPENKWTFGLRSPLVKL